MNQYTEKKKFDDTILAKNNVEVDTTQRKSFLLSIYNKNVLRLRKIQNVYLQLNHRKIKLHVN